MIFLAKLNGEQMFPLLPNAVSRSVSLHIVVIMPFKICMCAICLHMRNMYSKIAAHFVMDLVLTHEIASH